jgi:long-chain acyl-CoA synthetase
MQEQFNLDESFFLKPEVFVEDQEIINWMAQDIRKLSNELAKFERVKNFKLKRNPFTIEAGEITPTLKPKRKVIEKKYAEPINEMYKVAVEAD